jgi:hypothetical protein
MIILAHPRLDPHVCDALKKWTKELRADQLNAFLCAICEHPRGGEVWTEHVIALASPLLMAPLDTGTVTKLAESLRTGITSHGNTRNIKFATMFRGFVTKHACRENAQQLMVVAEQIDGFMRRNLVATLAKLNQ